MDRRGFFVNSALAGAASFAVSEETSTTVTSHAENGAVSSRMEEAISRVPIFCAHEHWGSINAVGMDKNGFRSDTVAGAEPQRDVCIWDIVLDPYFGGWVFEAGQDVHALAVKHGHDGLLDWWKQNPAQVLEMLGDALRAQHYTGAFQCIRQGIQVLHGPDITSHELAAWQQADDAIKTRYSAIFDWYQTAMKQLNVSTLIRPVHPEYFLDAGPRAADERAIMHPIMRIDSLLDLWQEKCPRRDRLAAALGVEPRDAKSWRNFITSLFDLAAKNGNVGIKQLQAYTRNLDFAQRSDREVKFSGALDHEEQIVFQDWVMHECCKQAHDRGWPHQIHAGTHNLTQSSPLPLGVLAERYPKMKLVLLHCWPFLVESGFLAKHKPNVYLDACWQTILNPAYMEQAWFQWLGYLPATKMMCSQDSTSIEMAAGSMAVTRRLLTQALVKQGSAGNIPETTVSVYASAILNNNAVAVYGVGMPCVS